MSKEMGKMFYEFKKEFRHEFSLFKKILERDIRAYIREVKVKLRDIKTSMEVLNVPFEDMKSTLEAIINQKCRLSQTK